MADIYPQSYSSRPQQSYHRHPDQMSSQPQQQYSQINTSTPYPPPLVNSGHSSSSSSDENNDPSHSPINKQEPQQSAQKPETKPQATFLTKLYALLERPENHHMIRWDPAGEHIIVERPEQLALHVLPSIYRQSRFASFSRQLNIYGFMRKVNLRNVDPAIDDPDASTWSHPTLNRHSPAEVVANFKRRVPPRLPKPRKRESQDSSNNMPLPRSAIGLGPVPLTVPSSVGHSSHKLLHNMGGGGRARGFSAPGSFTPLAQAGAAGWGTNYPRSALPPLTVPSDPPHLSHGSLYSHSSHTLHPITPTDEPPMSYSHHSQRDMIVPSSQYSYSEPQHNNWYSPVGNGGSSHSGSLSSLLNPSSGGYSSVSSRPAPTINTSYSNSPFSSMPMHNDHNSSSLSPDSRPTTGYSMSSVSSMPYDDHPSTSPHHGHHINHDYSRPNSSHRPISPTRPNSSKSGYPHNAGSLRIGRSRRHSNAMSPYPSPYEHSPSTESHHHQRPSTSPQPGDQHGQGSITRVRSMIQLPSVDPYSFSNSHADFAYSAVGHDTIDNGNNGWHNGNGRSSVRPSTGASSISAASHTSSSAANTPPVGDNYGAAEADINRFSPDFGYVAMNEHLPHFVKSAGEM